MAKGVDSDGGDREQDSCELDWEEAQPGENGFAEPHDEADDLLVSAVLSQ